MTPTRAELVQLASVFRLLAESPYRTEHGETLVSQQLLREAAALLDTPDEGRWQPIETAPVEGKFLVADAAGRCMVMDGHIYSLGLLPGTPTHLSMHHWTIWQPLPPLPDAERTTRCGIKGHPEFCSCDKD